MIYFFGLLILGVLFTVGITTLMPLYSVTFLIDKPVDCVLGSECFIQNYVDANPAKGKWSDYTCGPLSYDGHKGTDFRLKNLRAMEKGVNVLAVADGKILNVRDGMVDKSFRKLNPEYIKDRECGNGVVIEHANGYKSQYCHMKENSVTVKPEQEIKRGDVIGQIGLSGKTEFPHVHLQISNAEGKIIDPFSGSTMESSACGVKGERNFWRAEARKDVTYIPTGVLGSGWSISSPDSKQIRAGDGSSPASLPEDASAIIFWVDLMGLRKGDQLSMLLQDAQGKTLVNHAKKITGNKAQYFQFVGKKLSEDKWVNGFYRARYTLYRGTDKHREPIIKKESTILVGELPQEEQAEKPKEKAIRVLRID